MESREQNQNPDKSFERDVFEALEYYGYKVPSSEEDIDKNVRLFGNTKIELPNSLMDAGALFDNAMKDETSSNDNNDIIGMAARGDSENKLPDHIIEKIKSDFDEGKWLK